MAFALDSTDTELNENMEQFVRQVEELYQEYQGELKAYAASKNEPQDGADIPEEEGSEA